MDKQRPMRRIGTWGVDMSYCSHPNADLILNRFQQREAKKGFGDNVPERVLGRQP